MKTQVACFGDEIEPARRLADALGASLTAIKVHRFPDGETMPRVVSPLACDATVVYRSLDHPNRKLIDLLLAADALRRAGAKRLVLVAPYLCYLRQDAMFETGEPLSRDVIAPLVGAPFDALVTVQAHLHRTADLAATLGVPTINLWAVEPLAAALPAYAARPMILGPDAESAPWASAWAQRLCGEALSMNKIRKGDRRVAIEARAFDATGRPVVIVDDIAASGETLLQAVMLARRSGAASIDIGVVHAMMSAAAAQRLHAAGARTVVSTDSIVHPTNRARLGPMLSQAVRKVLAQP